MEYYRQTDLFPRIIELRLSIKKPIKTSNKIANRPFSENN